MSSPTDQAERLKQKGNELFKKADYKRALTKYNEACKLCPDVAVYWSNAAACYEKLEDYKGMKKASKRATEADESFVKGFYRLAVAQLQLEEFSDARVTIERGLALSQEANAQDFELLQLQLDDLVALVACAECGKAAASSVCSRCHVTSYCSRECQAAHWKEHKKSCEALASNCASVCQNCSKLSKSLRLCSKCNVAHYCSRTCQLQHWKMHKPVCDRNAQTSAMFASMGQSSQYELYEIWKSKMDPFLGGLGTLGMTKKQFLEQPPSFVVLIQVEFNFNFMTYLPTKDPCTFSITELSVDTRQLAEAALAEFMAKSAELMAGCSFLTHLFLIETEASMSRPSLIPRSLAAGIFHKYSREDIEKGIRSECNLNPALQVSWKPLFMQNIESQIQALKSADSINWTFFLVTTLRVYSTQPRYKTHVIVIDFELGFGLGQIGKVLEYKVIELQDARDLFLQAQNIQNMPPAEVDFVVRSYFDLENSPKLLQSRVSYPRNVLFPVIFQPRGATTAFADPSLYELQDRALWPPKKCDKKADECFRRLQNVSLPEVSSPDLANVKPAIH